MGSGPLVDVKSCGTGLAFSEVRMELKQEIPGCTVSDQSKYGFRSCTHTHVWTNV